MVLGRIGSSHISDHSMHGHTGRSDEITFLGLTNFGEGGFDYEKGMSMIDWVLLDDFETHPL